MLQIAAGPNPDRNHRPARISAPPALRPQPVHIEVPGVGDPQGAQQLPTPTVGIGEFSGGSGGPTRHRSSVPVSRALGEQVGAGVEGAAVGQPAIVEFEPLLLGAEADTVSRPCGKSEHGYPGHPLLTGDGFPLLRCAGAVVNDHPVRSES